MDNLADTSTNFDLADIRPFLERIASLGVIEAGLGPAEIDQLVAWVEGMEVDAEQEAHLTIRYRGQDIPFIVHVFMDDIESPDTEFRTHPDVVQAIRAEIRRYSEELGR